MRPAFISTNKVPDLLSPFSEGLLCVRGEIQHAELHALKGAVASDGNGLRTEDRPRPLSCKLETVAATGTNRQNAANMGHSSRLSNL
jgi:hypothetical protein